MNKLADAGARLIGGTIRQIGEMPGGSLSQIVQITLTDGRRAVVKNGPSPRTEAAMLRAIAASGAPAPAVLGADDEVLAIELVPAGGALQCAWSSLGSALALLHGTTGERYGWPQDYAFSGLAIVNSWRDHWPTFWAEHRLLVHTAHLPPSLARRVEALASDLPNRLPAHPAPSLLHGDLWGGNILVDGERVSGLIDPACYFGHGEVDIGMLTLFDHPAAAFYDAYGPRDRHREERLVIYRLWPALVHLHLFGGGYRAMVERFLSEAGV
ncbi:MAG: fructosamine kinase family protein [Alphaproteobacteria bacterium]|nr:fructosamine kinase family protein [Alphaproteobacteria bacterium]MDE2110678.1 fructosamine kinase family protein [Alphaproteobacteria bacterium]MDE2494483.1 fructosamine kinase family protein [Alphaproteobacteria bacterium]